MSIRRRLEALEDSVQPEPEDRSEVRAWMKASLDRIAAHRRGELGPEEAAKVEALIAAVERERARRRGEEGSR